VLIEIKCVKHKDMFIHRVANARRNAIEKHYGQVQALLEVFDLQSSTSL
jgi:hypothetical protein